MRLYKSLFLFILVIPIIPILLIPAAWAVPAAPMTSTFTQPDGTTFKARLVGDEWNNWTVTEDGYTILKDEASGYWVYAQKDAAGDLVGSSLIVGVDSPTGIEKGLRPKPRDIETFPPRSPSYPTAPQGPPFSGTGTHKVLVIRVNFSDKALSTTEAAWATRFFGGSSSVADYFDEVSDSNITISPAAESFGTANNGVVDVTLGSAHPDTGGVNNSNRQLTQDALLAANPFVDFSAFDTNPTDGSLSTQELHIVIIAGGYEAAMTGACTPNVWGHRWSLGWAFLPTYPLVAAPSLDGVTVADLSSGGGYTQFGERQGFGCPTTWLATIGIMVHELGHDLWLPDQYDTVTSPTASYGIGKWGVMGGGSWNSTGTPGDTPAHPGPWDKWYEGWLTPTQVTGTLSPSIPQVETSATVYQLLDNPGGVDWSFTVGSGSGEYFLVENRQLTGYDAGLPGCGILIWHIDESVAYDNTCNGNEGAPAPFHGPRLVVVEQADGLYQLENKTSQDDGGDPYTLGGVFNDASTPSSKLRNASSSGVSVTVGSVCGASMSVTMVTPADCTVDGDCDDSNDCTTDSCVALQCQYSNNTNDCDDGSECTTDDACSGGTCVGGPAPDCDDSNSCTDDSCDPAIGCEYSNNTAACDDGSECTTDDTCSSGVCVGGAPPDCDDSNSCTDDSCDPAIGCENTNNTAACDDGSECTTDDACSGGTCVGGPAPDCDDSDACTTDSCDAQSGQCINTPVDEGCDEADGDVNGDGNITPQDALMVFQQYLGLIQLNESQLAQADVNNDGNITPADALCIFQKYLGLSSCLD